MRESFYLTMSILLFILNSAFAAPLTMSELLASSQDSDWREADADNLLYMTLSTGQVVIELAPLFAPRLTANIRSLARERYWDDLSINRAQDNYVVQWGDPSAEDPKSKKPTKVPETLAAEFERALDKKVPFTVLKDGDIYAPEVGFSDGFPAARDPRGKKMWLTHCYGAVGAGRNTPAESGPGMELFAVIGHAPRHLDRNISLVGRVIDGMEHLSSLPRGTGPLGFYEKPAQRITIKSIRLGRDVPGKDRGRWQVLRTDTPLFQKVIESRRHRPEEWFHHRAGRIELCNVPIPVRKVTEK
jgi:peptidylprolyl isomerase